MTFRDVWLDFGASRQGMIAQLNSGDEVEPAIISVKAGQPRILGVTEKGQIVFSYHYGHHKIH